jgi:hypothetical protein
MRRWVVAQWGLPDTAVAKAEAAPRKSAAKKGKESARKTQVAKKSGGKKASAAVAKKASKTTVAKGKDDGKRKSVAKARSQAGNESETKQAQKKNGRVRQTFAAAGDGGKS